MMASQVHSSDKTLNRDSNVDISLFETRLGKGEREKKLQLPNCRGCPREGLEDGASLYVNGTIN